MRWRKNDNQKMADRRRNVYMKRISGERERENYDLDSRQDGVAEELKEGTRGMIKVTRLSGEVLYLNVFQIECMESIPETKIKMMNGYYFLVKDSADEVTEQIKDFFRSCIVPDGRNTGV